jgi:ABC-type dipeptide/oligopeptide/nickel transport system permease subunit
METQATNVAEIPGKPPLQQSRFIRVLRAVLRKKTAVFGGLVLGLFVLIAILAPVLVPHDPSQQNLKLRLAPPIGLGLENASIEYPLGNDNLGRDVFSRLIVGSRVSLVVGVITVVLTTLLGSMLGAMAGYYRGRIDNAIMRLVDIWMAFPDLLLAIAFAAALGPGLFNLIVALALTNWVVYCRVVRAEVLVLREQEYVLAARSLGGSNMRIIMQHILPNVLSSILVIATLQFGTVIVTEASMSFLGISVQSSVPTWGGMLADGREFMRQAWWLATFPGIAISVVVLGANLLGDGLRDALDPRL